VQQYKKLGFIIIAQLFFLICYAFPPIAECEDWIALRGNIEGRASIKYEGKGELKEWHYIYKSGRHYKMGLAVWASPALSIIGGKPMAFIGGYDQTMHALDLIDKKVVWQKITNGEIATAPAIGKVNGLDVVFWASVDRTVYAYVAFSGRQLWTKELIPPSSTLGDIHLSSPFLSGDKLYIACFVYDKSISRNLQKGWFYCLTMKHGDMVWKIPVTSGILTSPVGFFKDNQLYIIIAARKGLVQCFNVSDQVPKGVWRFQMPHEVFGSPVITTDMTPPLTFLGSKYGNLIAIDAHTGKEVWQKMAGNWIDNTACIGEIDDEKVVYIGSHDYHLYAFKAENGDLLWKRALGGEVYSAPCFFYHVDKALVAAASLDNHLYIMDARNGNILTSYFTGRPIWDKVAKGDTLWGSPVAIEAGEETALIHGSFNDVVYMLPIAKECSLRAMARSPGTLWWGLLFVLIIFGGIVLPVIINLPLKQNRF
jgi:outer membrane protein assembly factor BamB